VLPFKGEGLNIFWLFEATKGRQQFNEYKGHWPDFVIKKLVVPTLPLVSIFGEIIELNHQKIYANELKNQSLTKLRDTLLPKLISGELRMPEVKQLTNETLT
jgi:type I restriction enzyme S subunit